MHSSRALPIAITARVAPIEERAQVRAIAEVTAILLMIDARRKRKAFADETARTPVKDASGESER